MIVALKFFTVPILTLEQAEHEVNAFLRSHKVLAIDRRCVEQAGGSFWCICVDYLDGAAAAAPAGGRPAAARPKVDYREVLSPDDFKVFASLRDLRKQIAQDESVPVYAIFTNEHLAQIVQSRAASRADLDRIPGLGAPRLDKYAGRVLEVLAGAWKPSHEANGIPV